MLKKDVICDLILGLWDLSAARPPEADWVENEFDEGASCAELAQKVWDARERLAERLGTDVEDEDLLEMVDGYEHIQRILMRKMFDYGYLAARKGQSAALEN